MNEITVKTNELGLPSITWNKDEISNQVNELTKSYQGLVFDDSQLPIAKKDLAAIRKVKTNLNNEKKRVKKKWNENYTIFEKDLKVIMSQVDELVISIDSQVKTFELEQQEERRTEIQALDGWDEIKEFTTFDETWLLKKFVSKDDKLLKATFIDILNVIDSAKKTIKLTSATLKLDSEFYIEKLKTLSLEQVVERMNEDYANMNKKVEPTPTIQVDTTEKAILITRQLKGTMSQLKALKAYAEQIGVEWIK